jgi:hypothetical protein
MAGSQPDSDTAAGNGPSRPASWLPTHDGAVHRSTVTAFSVQRVDGDFKNEARSQWMIQVSTSQSPEPVDLRLAFYDVGDLCEFVDGVFPGAVFKLQPPRVVTESPEWGDRKDEPRYAQSRSGTIATAIREILEGMGGGDAYVPDQGKRPPPGADPVAI